MRRLLMLMMIVLAWGALLPTFGTTYAQGSTQSRLGDPPIASLISISPPDERGNVLVSGAVGSVFPNAQVAVRNLFTEQTVYANAGITGAFNVTIFANGSTPFWVSAAQNIPTEQRNLAGSLPGGPGTIITSTAPEGLTLPTTQLIMDGTLDDWATYPQSELQRDEVFILRNRQSIYLGIQSPMLVTAYHQLRLTLVLDDSTFNIMLNPQQQRAAAVRQSAPSPRDRGAWAVNVGIAEDAFELRIPLAILERPVAQARLTTVVLLDENNAELGTLSYDYGIPSVEEIDGIVYPSARLGSDAQPFYVAGALAQGAAHWSANGRIQQRALSAGDALSMELDFSLFVPDLPLTTEPLRFVGEVSLQPVTQPALNTNNGWSSLLTASGLAIDNVRGDVLLGDATTDWVHVTRLSDRLVFGMRFDLALPDALPAGHYVPVFKGYVELADGSRVAWTDANLFGAGRGISRLPLTRLPLVLNVDTNNETRLIWALFFDHPSDGSRGILAAEDTQNAALSNRVKFNSPTYILPPANYPVEPYIPNMLPNAYDSSASPLIPLLFPGGRLNVEITRPDGTRENLGSMAVLQNRLSTEAADERDRFGAQSPIDMYRLTTLNPQLTSYPFTQYGDYVINLTGQVEDRMGNRYNGGGTYRLLIADVIDLQPAVLSGTPFEVGDSFYAGLHLLPSLPADVTVKVSVYPLDGGEVIEQTISGKANRHGHFIPSDAQAIRFEVAGEYIIDYDARFTNAEGRIWAASLRSAGVIAPQNTQLIAKGRRGLDGYNPETEARPAWFTLHEYPTLPNVTATPRPYYPYHSGDIVVYADSSVSGVRPVLQLQDVAGAYTDWLRSTVPDYVSPTGRDLNNVTARDSLPLLMVLGGLNSNLQPALLPELIVNQAYGYVSAVRAGVSVRQFVQGNDDDTLPLYWDANDPLNGQIGAGINGDTTGDYVFLFGGAVVRNADAGIQEIAPYAALGITGFTEGDPLGVRVYPPYRGTPLLTVRGKTYQNFFHPTGTLPGQVMQLGDPLVIAGQAAPTLTTAVEVIITAPSGEVRTFTAHSNSIGYFYHPEHAFAVDEVGMWTVEINARPVGATSAGVVEEPLPVGGVLGAENNRFAVYVAAPESAPLVWNRGGDIDSQTPASVFFNFTIDIPSGLRNMQVYRTVTMPGYILDHGLVPSTPNSAGYQYSPQQLALLFPSLEATGRGTTNAASDSVTVTFAVIGTDTNDQPQLYSRTFAFMHNRIISFESVE